MRKELRIERLVIVATDDIKRGENPRCKWFNHGVQKRHWTLFYVWLGRFWINFHMVTLYHRNMTRLQHEVVRRRLGIL